MGVAERGSLSGERAKTARKTVATKTRGKIEDYERVSGGEVRVASDGARGYGGRM